MEHGSIRTRPHDRVRLEAEARRLAEQLAELGAVQVILFGSLARGRISLFSEIDLLALFEREMPARALTRWVYENIDTREAVDILAYGRRAVLPVKDRPFFKKVLREGKVLYGPGAWGESLVAKRMSFQSSSTATATPNRLSNWRRQPSPW